MIDILLLFILPSVKSLLHSADENTKTHSWTLHRDLKTHSSKPDVSIKSNLFTQTSGKPEKVDAEGLWET